MSNALEEILNAARNLPLDQQKLLAEKLLKEINKTDSQTSPAQAAAIEAVEKTHGTIKGLDRETLIQIAEDEELCGY